jgi:hypothetical protein
MVEKAAAGRALTFRELQLLRRQLLILLSGVGGDLPLVG